jgi:predicted phosphodiesterase
MLIHLQSDTHLEVDLHSTPDYGGAVADVIVCPGDIGLIIRPNQLKVYFDRMHQYGEHVIWVLGNHEFYHAEYHKALDNAWKIAESAGVHLMDVEYGTQDLEIDGVKFWGSSLWTDLNAGDAYTMEQVGSALRDFYVTDFKTDFEDRLLATEDVLAINAKTRDTINWDADVCISHHSPALVPNSKFALSTITYGFCNTGLDQQIADSNVKAWLYGHTHQSTEFDLNGTRVIANCVGYQTNSYNEDAGFDPNLIIEI